MVHAYLKSLPLFGSVDLSCSWGCILRRLCRIRRTGIKSLPVRECTDASTGVKNCCQPLETWSCHSRKLCDKAEACDHFLSVYFGDLRHISCIPFLSTFCLIHLSAAIFASSLSKAEKCTNAVCCHKRRAKKPRCNSCFAFFFLIELLWIGTLVKSDFTIGV